MYMACTHDIAPCSKLYIATYSNAHTVLVRTTAVWATEYMHVVHAAVYTQNTCTIFALKKARASGRNVGKVFNPVLKLVFENYPFTSYTIIKIRMYIYTQDQLATYMRATVYNSI